VDKLLFRRKFFTTNPGFVLFIFARILSFLFTVYVLRTHFLIVKKYRFNGKKSCRVNKVLSKGMIVPKIIATLKVAEGYSLCE